MFKQFFYFSEFAICNSFLIEQTREKMREQHRWCRNREILKSSKICLKCFVFLSMIVLSSWNKYRKNFCTYFYTIRNRQWNTYMITIWFSTLKSMWYDFYRNVLISIRFSWRSISWWIEIHHVRNWTQIEKKNEFATRKIWWH